MKIINKRIFMKHFKILKFNMVAGGGVPLYGNAYLKNRRPKNITVFNQGQ